MYVFGSMCVCLCVCECVCVCVCVYKATEHDLKTHVRSSQVRLQLACQLGCLKALPATIYLRRGSV